MNTLRNQMYGLVLSMLFALLATGYKAYNSLEKYFFYENQISYGKKVLAETKKIIKQKHSNENFQTLQKFRQQLDENKRQENFSKVVQAYGERKTFETKKNLDFFAKSEKKYIEFAEAQYPFLIQQFRFYGVITLALASFFIFGILVFVQISFLKPIKDLNRKMIDFLNEKYTYQFIVPKNNEMGNLQSTFNSLAQQVLASIEELKELDKAKSEFLSIASHELRTPLTSIKGSLSLLQQGIAGPLPESAQNLVNIANVESERLIRLINDILDLTKIEARMLPLKQDWYELDKLLNKTIDSLKGLSEAAHVEICYSPQSTYILQMDFDRIQQVLTNLLSNAIKHSPENTQIHIQVLRHENGQLKICVKDQGRGIAPEDQELIFQQFRQATSEENPLVKGTGLGLAIAKALVEQHKGLIGVESKYGEGSTFYFTLPHWRKMSDKAPTLLPEEKLAS
ncbi:MAG: HAMP domain-containing histidine kinase [Bdellovibrionales bacterium]|nr:HAMP domain-containing histidine kinase [Bdellovibrionales bacterium]